MGALQCLDVAFASTSLANYVIASDNAGGAAGKILTYSLATDGTFTAIDSVTGFTSPAGVLGIAINW